MLCLIEGGERVLRKRMEHKLAHANAKRNEGQKEILLEA